MIFKSGFHTVDGWTPDHCASYVVKSTFIFFLSRNDIIFKLLSSLLDSFLGLPVLGLAITDDVSLYLLIVFRIPHLGNWVMRPISLTDFPPLCRNTIWWRCSLKILPFCFEIIIIINRDRSLFYSTKSGLLTLSMCRE